MACWGNNEHGELGVDAANSYEMCTNGARTCIPHPIPLIYTGTVEALEAGGQHACAILIDGTVGCWGSNEQRQLGPPSAQTLLSISLESRVWDYAGPTLLSPCGSEDANLTRGVCWRNISGTSTKMSVAVQDGAQLVDPSSGDGGQVAGIMTFFDAAGAMLDAKPFCVRGRFAVPSGTNSVSVELYEGAAEAPLSLQRVCTISAPIEGTISLVVTSLE